eukprot:c21735_g1_i1 orf=283-1797(+)
MEWCTLNIPGLLYAWWQIAAGTSLVLLIGIYSGYVNRDSKQRGQRWWPHLRWTLKTICSFDYHHDYLTAYAKRFTTFEVFYFWRRVVYTANPDNVEHILKTNFNNYMKGSTSHHVQYDLFGLGIFNTDGELWKRQRKIASVEFSSKSFRDHGVAAFTKYSLRLAEILTVAAQKNQVMDMHDLFMRMTFDSICEVGFGVEVGSLSKSLPLIPFATAFSRSNVLSSWRFFDPTWKLKRYLSIGYEKKMKEDVGLLDRYTFSLIREKEREDVNTLITHDLLSRYLVLSKENPLLYNEKSLRDTVLNFTIAGRDTTAGTLSWFLYLIAKHPEVETKLLEELMKLELRIGEETSPSHTACKKPLCDLCIVKFANLLNVEAIGKMHYLHASLAETLRLYPAVPVNGKEALQADELPDGTKMRAGDSIVYLPYAMGRLENLWSADAEEFKPERWLKNGVFNPISPYKFPAFHARLQVPMITFTLLSSPKRKFCYCREEARLDKSVPAILLL